MFLTGLCFCAFLPFVFRTGVVLFFFVFLFSI
uniref:Uncharacterized protein n=1 Tax=Anguilla anguilla TaxID=7936 RepID=A0A0E9UX63_ANGAN